MDRLYQTTMAGEPWMHRCPACGLCAISPIPKSLGQVYDDAYTAASGADRKNRLLAPDYFRKIARFLPGGSFRFLEVGGAYGWLAELVRDRCKADVLLLEPGQTAVRMANARGLTAVAGFVEAYQPDLRFDVVCAAHVIEHVDDLESFLAACHRVIVPGGLLILLTPNARAWKLSQFGRAWAWAVPDQHTYFLSREGATRLLERSGFDMVAIREATPAFAHYPFFLTRWLAERSAKSSVIEAAPAPQVAVAVPDRKFPWRRWLVRPLVVAEFVLLRIFDFLHPSEGGDELLVVARRR